MYACLFAPATPPAVLYELALQFSPAVEQTDETTVVFSIDPLRRLLGSPHQIASEISRAGHERKLRANLAIASNPDSAILLARHYSGITLATPGEEQTRLDAIPLTSLFAQIRNADFALLQVLHRWGLKTCGELAVLPESGIAERLGSNGVYLRNVARGAIRRPLHLTEPGTDYTEHVELEDSIALLEPLLFLLGRSLEELSNRLRAQSRAARFLHVEFKLDGEEPYRCKLEFPVPLADHRSLLKLLQLYLDRHPPQAAVTAFTLRVEPVEPRRTQNGLFLPPTPAPDKLQVTLARIAELVGKENVGTPVLLDTYRPDGFEMKPLPELGNSPTQNESSPDQLPLVIRMFRPALPARVRLVEDMPHLISARNVKGAVRGVEGKVLQFAGPWKTSGEWWAATFWNREEWDVALDDGAFYRIYQDAQSRAWYVQGVYD